MSALQSTFEPIDHTADLAYRLFAPTIEELFVVAARALFDAITELEDIQPKFSRKVIAEADDVEGLLVAWLSELNFYCINGLEIFSKFEVDSFLPVLISATVHGEKIDLSRHNIKTEIKAVTYHGLYVRQVTGGWEAQVIFDV